MSILVNITPRLISALLVLSLLLPTAFAQRMYDGSGRQLGRVDAERFYSASGQPIGRVDGERIYDASGRQLGRIEGERVYSASGSPIGRIHGERLYSASGSLSGPHGRRASLRCIGSPDRPRRWAAAHANDRVLLFLHVRLAP